MDISIKLIKFLCCTPGYITTLFISIDRSKLIMLNVVCAKMLNSTKLFLCIFFLLFVQKGNINVKLVGILLFIISLAFGMLLYLLSLAALFSLFTPVDIHLSKCAVSSHYHHNKYLVLSLYSRVCMHVILLSMRFIV